MNRKLQLLLEAVVFTVCLIWVAGYQAQAKTLTSKAAIKQVDTIEHNLSLWKPRASDW